MKNKATILFSILFLLINSSISIAMNSINNDLALNYLVRLPKNITQNVPVIIFLHGVGGNENDLFRFENDFPEHLVISARAPFELSVGSYAWFQVNFIGDKRVINANQAEKSRQILIQFIDQIIKKYDANSKNVTLFGFSQGAVMSYSVALTAPEKVKNITAMSGRILDEIKPFINKENKNLKLLNVFLGHGNNDLMMPLSYANAAYDFCKELGCNIQFNKYPMEHFISNLEMEDFKDWLQSK